jgi:hypothetical protein
MSTICVTDGELVALARQGDHDAFGELVTRVAQSADPVSDRQVTVEVRATILK